MQLSIVVPAYNEQDCIEHVVANWLNLSTSVGVDDYALIVVDDGSTDKTGQILDSLLASNPKLVVVHQKNAGHGAALMTGYQRAINSKSEWVFQVDSDDQFQSEDFVKLWREKEKSKFIMGYREQRNDPLPRLIITRFLRVVLLLFYGVYLKDSNIPYRLMQRGYLEVLYSQLPKDVFAPNIFLAVLAAKDKQNLMFIPITHQERQTGKVSILKWRLIKVCFRSFKELLSFRLNLNKKLQAIRDVT